MKGTQKPITAKQTTTATTTSLPEYGPHVPEDKDQYLVQTPYGPGLVIRTTTRRCSAVDTSSTGSITTMREIILTGWSQSTSNNNNNNNTYHETGSTGSDDTNINPTINDDDHNGRPIRPTMLYTCMDYPTIPPMVGSDVICSFGRGRVMELRQQPPCDDDTLTLSTTDGGIVVAVVRLSSWRLARRNTVTCYLQLHLVRTVRRKQIYEMSIIEKIEVANEIKGQAAMQYQLKHYDTAIGHYERAIAAVRYVQHDANSTNWLRADLLIVMITCCNNTATCYMQQQQQQLSIGERHKQQQQSYYYNYERAYYHAQQAISLIDAIEGKRGGRIHTELNVAGYDDVRIFGEWKIKSLYIIARVVMEKDDNVPEAMMMIKNARQIIATYSSSTTGNGDSNGGTNVEEPSSKEQLPSASSKPCQQQQQQQVLVLLRKYDRDFIKLYHKCKERQKELYKIEKSRAQAMFVTSTPTSSSNTTTTTTSTVIQSTTPTTPPISSSVVPNQPTVVTTIEATVLERNTTNDFGRNNNSEEEKKSDSTSTMLTSSSPPDYMLKSGVNNNNNIASRDNNAAPRTGVTKTANDDDDTIDSTPWHKDQYFLGGLGFVIGTIGTLLVLSQLVLIQQSSSPSANKRS